MNINLSDSEIRTFVAVELPEDVKSAFLSIQNDLRMPDQNFVRWVAPAGMHLTLKFLGNVDVSRVDQIVNEIRKGCEGQKLFSIQLSGLGTFPGFKKPRVLWIGITDQLNELVGLQKKIDYRLEIIGFEKEKRPFSPHITLARIGDRALSGQLAEFSEKLQSYKYDKKHVVRVDSVNFIRSQLLPAGAKYNTLAEVKLNQY